MNKGWNILICLIFLTIHYCLYSVWVGNNQQCLLTVVLFSLLMLTPSSFNCQRVIKYSFSPFPTNSFVILSPVANGSSQSMSFFIKHTHAVEFSNELLTFHTFRCSPPGHESGTILMNFWSVLILDSHSMDNQREGIVTRGMVMSQLLQQMNVEDKKRLCNSCPELFISQVLCLCLWCRADSVPTGHRNNSGCMTSGQLA